MVVKQALGAAGSSAEVSKRQQQAAIEHKGAPARLLAGPGTGKTWALTERVIRLVKDPSVLPTNILALTFTRAAAQELRKRVRDAAGEAEAVPPVSTLHSFALSQILRNGDKIDSLPQPLRIADEWEVREIVEPDIKRLLGLKEVRGVRDLFQNLSSDWETLRADNAGWEKNFPNPEFIGAWHSHRDLYGYTLLAELVYQLKRAIQQTPAFEIDGPPLHLLVDEYQDLNQCDIAVVDSIRERGAELYVSGDDDQSIYGFRNAHPLAIREFTGKIGNARDLRLGICRRCAPEILRIADFVIKQEVGRLPKTLRPQDERKPGRVALRRYATQTEEAAGIAEECARLVADGVEFREILILLRSDRNGAFSKVIEAALRSRELPTHTDVGGPGPFDSHDGRRLLSLLRIAVEREDALAWRSLIQIDRNSLGAKALISIEERALGSGQRFSAPVLENLSSDTCGSISARLRRYAQGIVNECEGLAMALDVSEFSPDDRSREFQNRLTSLDPTWKIENESEFQLAIEELVRIGEDVNASDVAKVIGAIGTTRQADESVIDPSAINILSMHRAKGLGAHAVFVAAAEDEYIPGRADTAAKVDEERRLLYVSITRAREELFITYCNRRTGQQQHTGRASGARRTLTRFLRDSYLVPE